MSERVAIIGGGKIGEALVAGLLSSGKPARDLVVVEASSERAEEIAQEYKVLVTDIATAVENAQIVVIAVKPDAVDGVLAELGKVDDNNDVERVTVTLVAGLPAAKYENALPAGSPVIRVMSNTPLLVNEAMSAMSAGRYATEEQVQTVSALLGAVGKVMVVPENLMDAVTAISGSGPAYVFLLAESMIDAGVSLGLTRAQAAALARQTIRGAGAMLTESGMTSTDLRAAVTSPGGTTAAAIIELERAGIRPAMYAATAAAAARSSQLSRRSELEGSPGNGGDGRG
ncbi:pyrroline-5-carboxylate reductase [Gordonia crocea]|uniref:Pyrroline-5-carboxylate reductase n=1 Tax=Gordonia crocea TaxID=589162 RepID=A0A7I9V0M2_9ACTN|nr:pyrroline-5-carboxylate reductase [Gordonia crocea]GED99004.1 pyrroline-5-carboxylate reductase [Gordonia crocea]